MFVVSDVLGLVEGFVTGQMALPDPLNGSVLHKLLVFVYWKRSCSHVLFFRSVGHNFALHVQIRLDVGVVDFFIGCHFSQEFFELWFWPRRRKLILVSSEVFESAGIGGWVGHHSLGTEENFLALIRNQLRTFLFRGLRIYGAEVAISCSSMITMLHPRIWFARSVG